jgi:sulfite reductase alpha subunit-like flavoprotein
MAPVALVYGSFFMGDCERDIATIRKAYPGLDGLEIAEPVTGDDFDFDSLKDTKVLVICTSSQYGFPPKNFGKFAHNLLTAATKHPGCLKGLQHVVYGNGDDTYFKTFMNMPRYMDMLLEKAGSRRFYARGETGEPCAPLDTAQCRCEAWAPAMWTAAAEAVKAGPSATPVAFDALWAKEKSHHHHKVTEWKMAALEKKMKGVKVTPPAMFSKL